MRIFTLLLFSVLTILLPRATASGADDPLAAIRSTAEEGQTRKALGEVDSYLRGHPKDFGGRLLKGSLLVQIGDTRNATRVFQELIREHPEKPEAYNNLAVLYAEAGRYEEAAETLKRALATHPSYSVAYENLGRVYGRSASEAYSRALGVEPPAKSGKERLVLLQETTPVTESEATILAALQPSPRESPRQEAVQEPTRTRAPGEESAAPATPPSAGSEGTIPQPTKPDPKPSTPADRPPSTAQTQPLASVEEEILALVREWARAWTNQQPEEYLSFYAPDFRIPKGLSRGAWEAQRRERLSKPRFIRVVIRNLRPPVATANGAEVQFVQAYSSDRFADKVSKTLQLTQIDGSWKIMDERTNP